jgi:hypothetical protein
VAAVVIAYHAALAPVSLMPSTHSLSMRQRQTGDATGLLEQ